jgi:hypothetical protein
MNIMSEINEKLHELQESMQKLQLLKQLGTDKLILEQEQEVFRIQQDIMKLNNNTSVDIIDAILPKKCKFCSVKTTEEDRLDCYEKIGDSCKEKEPKFANMLNMGILKVALLYLSLLALLITFLLLTNILFKYITGETVVDKIMVFSIAVVGLALVILLFRKPVKNLYASL